MGKIDNLNSDTMRILRSNLVKSVQPDDVFAKILLAQELKQRAVLTPEVFTGDTKKKMKAQKNIFRTIGFRYC